MKRLEGQAIARRGGVWVEEDAQNGAISGPTLMGLADRIHEGEITTTPAITEARAAIAQATQAA
jgi:hypothetical protein